MKLADGIIYFEVSNSRIYHSFASHALDYGVPL
jgi:hypothetical protein